MYLTTGVLAGLSATLVSYPLDVIRTNLAAQGTTVPCPGAPRVRTRRTDALTPSRAPPGTPHRTMAEAVRFLTQTVGYGGFFRGITPTLISVLPYSAVQFYAFETLTRALMAQTSPARGAAGEGKPSVSVSGVCGLAAGALAQGCTHPLDVVKKRFQVSGLPRTGSGFGAPIQSGQYANMLDCIRKVRARRPSRARVRRASAARARARLTPPAAALSPAARQIVRHEGVRGLYKGYLTSVAKAAPASAITFTVYKECHHLLGSIG